MNCTSSLSLRLSLYCCRGFNERLRANFVLFFVFVGSIVFIFIIIIIIIIIFVVVVVVVVSRRLAFLIFAIIRNIVGIFIRLVTLADMNELFN